MHRVAVPTFTVDSRNISTPSAIVVSIAGAPAACESP